MTTLVIGGGLAGALTARALDQHGVEVMVVDAGPEPGGVTVPIGRNGYVLEPAAGTVLLPHPHLGRLLDGLEVKMRPAGSAAVRRFVRHRGVTAALVPGPRLVGTPLLSWGAKLRLLAEPFVGSVDDPDQSLETFLTRRLGRETGRLAARLMAAGVHAGDPSHLSAAAAFPQLASVEARHGSLLRGAVASRRHREGPRPVTHVVEGGTASIAREVAGSLGEAWRSSWPVERLERKGRRWRVHGPETVEADRVVAAVPAEELAVIHPGSAGSQPWDWAPVAVVWLGITAPILPEGIGVLFGPEEQTATLGILYESAYAPQRAPSGRGLVKALVGGAIDPGAVERPDRELTEWVIRDLEAAVGGPPQVEMSHVVRHRPGIPQYTSARRRAVEALRGRLPPGLAVTGWAYDGVGVSQLASAAFRLGEQLSTP